MPAFPQYIIQIQYTFHKIHFYLNSEGINTYTLTKLSLKIIKLHLFIIINTAL